MRLAIVGGMLGLAAMALPAAANVSSSVLSFEDNKMSFKSCDGQNLRPDGKEPSFPVSIPGKKHGAAQPVLNATSVGTVPAGQLSWDMKAQRFVHAGDKGNKVDRIINYVGGMGAEWYGHACRDRLLSDACRGGQRGGVPGYDQRHRGLARQMAQHNSCSIDRCRRVAGSPDE